MEPPPGLSHPPHHVCRLRRALYGLFQAPRAWFERFATAMLEAVSMTRRCLFVPLLDHVSFFFFHGMPKGSRLYHSESRVNPTSNFVRKGCVEENTTLSL